MKKPTTKQLERWGLVTAYYERGIALAFKPGGLCIISRLYSTGTEGVAGFATVKFWDYGRVKMVDENVADLEAFIAEQGGII